MERARISKYAAFVLNVKLIYRALKNEEIHRPLVFFVMMGFVIPTYDNVHYYFLLNTCGMSIYQYDMLSILSFVGVAFGTLVYLRFLRNIEVWKLIFASLIIRIVLTLITLLNVLRINLEWGISDLHINSVVMLVSKANVLCLGVLPMTVLISYVIPKNIESSMFAAISAGIQFSSAWGSEMIGSIICALYGVSTEQLGEKYS